MAKRIAFTETAWQEYLAWQSQDKKTLVRINDLLKDIARNGPPKGIGKPEPLRGNLSGFWSRRIDAANRLVYSVSETLVEVIPCKGHYSL